VIPTIFPGRWKKYQMAKLTNLPFNPKHSTIMHLDINSCFATIEQQANPKLRGKPIAVAAYPTDNGCILAPSIEAKALGIKTGMRVKEGKLIYPKLTILSPDPWKYRDVHLKLRTLLKNYTEDVVPKSIDEFVLSLEGYPAFKKGMREVALEIKQRIKKEIGEWITISVGLAPNRFLAKTAAGLRKPDGLEEINRHNFLEVYSGLSLTDLCGIKQRNAARLGSKGIYTVIDFYNADVPTLRSAFASINGYYWYLRLHGWEIDDVIFGRRSYGNSYALPKPLIKIEDLAPILYKLVEKTGRRLRRGGYKASGVHVAVSYRDGSYWHHGRLAGKMLFDSRDIYKEAFRILSKSPYKKPVAILAESCFGLVNSQVSQTDLFENIERKERLVGALDNITEKWGEFVITPAQMLYTDNYVPDRISFGGVKELEEFTLDL
jgi:DNA polymerase IV